VSRDSAVGITTGYGQGQDFSPLHVVQTCSGAHPAYALCPMGTGDSFLGGKAAEAWSWPLSAELKNTWIYRSTPPYVFMA
jgi:hypothetical protein